MQLTMPPTRPGALSQDEYLNIVAFVLQSNGAPAGNQPLATTTAAADVAIGAVASGQAPAAQARRDAEPRLRAAAGGGRGRGAAPPVGITVEGEVKNYVPVTDAMLRDSRSERLADDSARLPREQLQPAESDHRGQRQGPAACSGSGR